MVDPSPQANQRRSKSPGLPSSYYDFGRYVWRERMLTFWYQLRAVLDLQPSSVLEIGVGPRVVTGVLRELGVQVRTADVNSALQPDFVTPVQALAQAVGEDAFDVVLCARVLQHVPFQDFEQCIEQLAKATSRAVVLTLPADDLRLYFGFRISSRRNHVVSLPLPLFLKRIAERLRRKPTGLWKVGGDRATGLNRIEDLLAAHFVIEKSFRLPEDQSHHVFVLKKRKPADGVRSLTA